MLADITFSFCSIPGVYFEGFLCCTLAYCQPHDLLPPRYDDTSPGLEAVLYHILQPVVFLVHRVCSWCCAPHALKKSLGEPMHYGRKKVWLVDTPESTWWSYRIMILLFYFCTLTLQLLGDLEVLVPCTQIHACLLYLPCLLHRH